jgi:Ca2+-binding RTX toxin-like protein
MITYAFRRGAAATAGLVAGLMGLTVAEAVGSQGGSATTQSGREYLYTADASERNQLTIRQAAGRFDLLDRGVVLIRPASPLDDPLICDYRLNRVSCPSVGEVFVNLGDGDDTIDSQGVMLNVVGREGRDVVRTNGLVSFIPGPGADDLIAPAGDATWDYEIQTGSMHIDLDGVADDGPPGEGDNVRPGTAVVKVSSGDHVLIGDDTANVFTVGGSGHSVLEGGGGNDQLASNQNGGATIRGGAGDDYVFGSAGPDLIEGGDGNDNLQAYYGVDQVDAGPGDDIVQSWDDAADAVDCGDGTDKVIVDALDTTTNCETVQVGY